MSFGHAQYGLGFHSHLRFPRKAVNNAAIFRQFPSSFPRDKYVYIHVLPFIMSDRGRSRSPKPLSPSSRHSDIREISMSHSRSRSRSRSLSPSRIPSPLKTNGSGPTGSHGFKVVVVGGLTKNVQRGHLEEIFGEYGRVTGCDLPVFKVCECSAVYLEVILGREGW